MLDRQAILADINQQIQSGRQLLPGFPDIAIRVRKAIEKDLSMADIAKIIQTDIPLTTRIIQIANSPLYRGVTPVEHCEGAISRLGLEVTRNLVVSFALRRLLTEKHAKTRKQLESLWKHSIKVASLAFILARITPGFDPSRAMLGGLVHDIGILPLLSHAEAKPELLADMKAFEKLCADIRVALGEKLLRYWHFDEDFIQIVREAEHWQRDDHAKPDYADVIIIAQLHSVIGDAQKQSLWPKPQEVPAYRKFHVFDLGPGASVELISEAQDEIAELQSLLKV